MDVEVKSKKGCEISVFERQGVAQFSRVVARREYSDMVERRGKYRLNLSLFVYPRHVL